VSQEAISPQSQSEQKGSAIHIAPTKLFRLYLGFGFSKHCRMEQQSTPTHESSAPMFATPDFKFEPSHDEPLYTEINIPLPRLPSPPRTSLSPPHQTHNRNRARSLSSLASFTRARSSSTTTSSPNRSSYDSPHTSSPSRASDDYPRIRPSILKNREIAAAMDLNHASKRGRSSTIDALAVVPAVLVLSAELFTPAEKSGKEMGRDDGGKGRGRKDSGHASAGASGWRRWEGGLR
jgi:hypothetical protein